MEFTNQDLIKASLRMRQTKLLSVKFVVCGSDVDASGVIYRAHDGFLVNSCLPDALRRLETMVLMGMDMPLGAIGNSCFFCRPYSYTFGKMPERREKDIRDK